MLYLVTYDLNTPGQDYAALYEVLKSAESWWHYLDSTWILYSHQSLSDWQSHIQQVVDDNDNFIIFDVTHSNRNGWLPRAAWQWLEDHGSLAA